MIMNDYSTIMKFCDYHYYSILAILFRELLAVLAEHISLKHAVLDWAVTPFGKSCGCNVQCGTSESQKSWAGYELRTSNAGHV